MSTFHGPKNTHKRLLVSAFPRLELPRVTRMSPGIENTPENVDVLLNVSQAFDATGRLLVALVRHHPQLVSEQLPAVLPWARFLPATDVGQLAAEFVAVAEACGSTGNLAPLAQLLTEWQHTAEVHADPQLYRALTRDDLSDHGPVLAPAVARASMR